VCFFVLTIKYSIFRIRDTDPLRIFFFGWEIDYMTWKATTVIPCTIPSPPQSDDDMYYFDDISHDIPPVLTSDPLATPPLNAPTDKNHTIISSQPPPLPGQVAVPPLREFISNLVRKSGLHTGTFLATLVYLDRLRRSLYTVAKGKTIF
jgi:hypothetical protein